MILGDDGDDRVAVEELGAEEVVVGGLERAGETDVDCAGFEGFHLKGGVHFEDREFYVWVSLSIFADDGGEEAAGSPEEEADIEGALLPEERSAGEIDGTVGCGEGLPGFLEEDDALGSKARGALAAIEEGASEFVLKVGDLLGDGGLRDVEVTTGLAECSVLGDRAKVS